MVNPEKIQALMEMKHPTAKKDVQQLMDRVAALSRFISRPAEKYLLFFKILKQMRNLQCPKEWWVAFNELKCYLGSPLPLFKPTIGEDLYSYLSISPIAISSVLLREDAVSQKLIYYTSKLLQDVELRYLKAERIIYALITTA